MPRRSSPRTASVYCRADGTCQTHALWLIEQNRHQRGRLDDHESGSPALVIHCVKVVPDGCPVIVGDRARELRDDCARIVEPALSRVAEVAAVGIVEGVEIAGEAASSTLT